MLAGYVAYITNVSWYHDIITNKIKFSLETNQLLLIYLDSLTVNST